MESAAPDSPKCFFPSCDNAGTEIVNIGDDAGAVIRDVCRPCLSERFL